jgi:hypothetical protein
MFEKDRLFGEVSPSNLEAYRDAKCKAAREELSDAQIERELAELDDAICGWDAAQMEALRDWLSEAEPQEDEDSGVVRKPR